MSYEEKNEGRRGGLLSRVVWFVYVILEALLVLYEYHAPLRNAYIGLYKQYIG